MSRGQQWYGRITGFPGISWTGLGEFCVGLESREADGWSLTVALASQVRAWVNKSLCLALAITKSSGAGITGSLCWSFHCSSSITGKQGAGMGCCHWKAGAGRSWSHRKVSNCQLLGAGRGWAPGVQTPQKLHPGPGTWTYFIALPGVNICNFNCNSSLHHIPEFGY